MLTIEMKNIRRTRRPGKGRQNSHYFPLGLPGEPRRGSLKINAPYHKSYLSLMLERSYYSSLSSKKLRG